MGVVFGRYWRFPRFDEALHAYDFFTLTLLVAVQAHGVVLAGGRRHGFLLVLTVAVIGLGLGALRKIAEFGYEHFMAKPDVILPKLGITIDMIPDTAGALVAGLVCLRMPRRWVRGDDRVTAGRGVRYRPSKTTDARRKA